MRKFHLYNKIMYDNTLKLELEFLFINEHISN